MKTSDLQCGLKISFIFFLFVLLGGCSASRDRAVGHLPRVWGPSIQAGDIPDGQSKWVQLSNGAEIVIQKFNGKLYFQVEGTYTEEAFSKFLAPIAKKSQKEKQAFLFQKTNRVFSKVKRQGGFALSRVADVGYFTFFLPYKADLTSVLYSLDLDTKDILLNPVVYDRTAFRALREFSPLSEGLEPRLMSSQTNLRSKERNDGFSGLSRMRVPEFLERAQADIGGGVLVDGELVKLGITDTGITYNHRTFLSQKAKGVNRIQFIGDFTREGRVYFHPRAKFEVQVPEGTDESDLLINAEVITTPRLPAVPLGDDLSPIKDLLIKVSPELKNRLTTPGSAAKLGVLFEESLQSEHNRVDLNSNGNLDDRIYMILVPGATSEEDVLYVDASGTGDFREAEPLRDWNQSHQSVRFFAEKFGFTLRTDELPQKNGDPVFVRSASLAGFDPGNHGTHVAGIAAGSKTILNDLENTLARGVAPEAQILMERVCAVNMGCNATQAIIELVMKAGAELVNMSLGGLSPFNDGYGVQETIINRLTTNHNALFFISAGNSGPGRQTVGSPSVARLALSVGATSSREMIQRQYQWVGESLQASGDEIDQDFVFYFSSRGPTAAGGFKPNFTAPGTVLSAVRLNAAPGDRAGLDIYWGTSMAAPSASGAYALLLDAIKKYNLKNPESKLTTDALLLRLVLMETARPFDVSQFDPKSGQKTVGKYTWIDQGTGMVDLLAAWKKLFELRDQTPPAAVYLHGKPVELEYQVIVSNIGPNGIPYDGSRSVEQGTPAFGGGLYLNFQGVETLRPIYIARKIPENLASGPDSAELSEQLVQTQDSFVLKTIIYGSGKKWIRAGVLEHLNCEGSLEEEYFSLQGRGVDIETKPDGTGVPVPFSDSTLYLCIDREMIAQELGPGDHGAMVSAYRRVGNVISPVPSFMVPIYLTVPHKTLKDFTAYAVEGTVESFGISRHYISVPDGTSVLKLTLEVPALKLDATRRPARGETCSGVELMALEGANTVSLIQGRAQARVQNCARNGVPILDEQRRRLTVVRTNPKPGVWDIHLFGLVNFLKSKYTMRIDYITGESSLNKIEGNLSALSGSLVWSLKDASHSVKLDAQKSSFLLDGLFSETSAQVQKGEKVYVEGALGVLRVYPAEAKSVTITTGASLGNDLDLSVLECDQKAENPADKSCAVIKVSAGATDEERVEFSPKGGKTYAVQVEGYEVSKNEGHFSSGEFIGLFPEKGNLEIMERGSDFEVHYSMSSDQISKSKILGNELFLSGRYEVSGSLAIRTSEWLSVANIPVRIQQERRESSGSSDPTTAPAPGVLLIPLAVK